MGRVVACAWALCVVGCGAFKEPPPPDLSAEACVLDFADGVQGSLGCESPFVTIAVIWDGKSDRSEFVLTRTPSTGALIMLQAGLQRPGQPVPGRWSDDPGFAGGVSLQSLNGDGKSWNAAAGGGGITLDVSMLQLIGSQGGDDGGVSQRGYFVHGTLHATLTPVSGTTRNVDFSARF
jgi:hypothetical protein